MPQLPTLSHAASKSVPRLKDSDLDAMLQQDICTPQTCETSTHNANVKSLFRFRHDTLEHDLRTDVLIRVRSSRVQVLEDTRRASGIAVRPILAALHRNVEGSGDTPAVGLKENVRNYYIVMCQAV